MTEHPPASLEKRKHLRIDQDMIHLEDDFALQLIALLSEGHCITLIQQLVTGQVDTSAATVSAEPDVAGAFAPSTLRLISLLVANRLGD